MRQSLTFANAFVFAKIMQGNKELCKKLLEIILKIKIRDIFYHKARPFDMGVRADVYVEDGANSVIYIEMQMTDEREIPKKSRYYQGLSDVDFLDRDENATYRDLKRTYIIYICLEDVIGAGRHFYYFENTCREDPNVKLDDGAIKVVLNADSDMNDVDGELANFLNYLKSGQPADDFTSMLDRIVRMVW